MDNWYKSEPLDENDPFLFPVSPIREDDVGSTISSSSTSSDSDTSATSKELNIDSESIVTVTDVKEEVIDPVFIRLKEDEISEMVKEEFEITCKVSNKQISDQTQETNTPKTKPNRSHLHKIPNSFKYQGRQSCQIDWENLDPIAIKFIENNPIYAKPYEITEAIDEKITIRNVPYFIEQASRTIGYEREDGSFEMLDSHTNLAKYNKKLKTSICLICFKIFNLDWRLRIHLNAHFQPFRCRPCNYKTAKTSNLKRHLTTKTHLENLADQVQKGIIISQEETDAATRKEYGFEAIDVSKNNGKSLVGETFECKSCNYTTSNMFNLTRHQKSDGHFKMEKMLLDLAEKVENGEHKLCNPSGSQILVKKENNNTSIELCQKHVQPKIVKINPKKSPKKPKPKLSKPRKPYVKKNAAYWSVKMTKKRFLLDDIEDSGVSSNSECESVPLLTATQLPPPIKKLKLDPIIVSNAVTCMTAQKITKLKPIAVACSNKILTIRKISDNKNHKYTCKAGSFGSEVAASVKKKLSDGDRTPELISLPKSLDVSFVDEATTVPFKKEKIEVKPKTTSRTKPDKSPTKTKLPKSPKSKVIKKVKVAKVFEKEPKSKKKPGNFIRKPGCRLKKQKVGSSKEKLKVDVTINKIDVKVDVNVNINIIDQSFCPPHKPDISNYDPNELTREEVKAMSFIDLKAPPAERYKCKICLEGFDNEDILPEHINSHATAFKCELCKFTSPYKSSFDEHLNSKRHKRKRENFVNEVSSGPVQNVKNEEVPTIVVKPIKEITKFKDIPQIIRDKYCNFQSYHKKFRKLISKKTNKYKYDKVKTYFCKFCQLETNNLWTMQRHMIRARHWISVSDRIKTGELEGCQEVDDICRILHVLKRSVKSEVVRQDQPVPDKHLKPDNKTFKIEKLEVQNETSGDLGEKIYLTAIRPLPKKFQKRFFNRCSLKSDWQKLTGKKGKLFKY